ncbi:MAG: putative papain-like cysteine peptidase [Edafosvirus sp.]|uniref:Putative papain-like cysteine peptidase n=1 Tax=Edafosvirus sp. TaxID=2487765 RepID=A0A3G4ZUJ1_9VIRU|nr:MAG: putative papain-like cysteine peptidase [Edafosvirus sp.]
MTNPIIPLGSTCGIAYLLQTNKLRTCAYPFDWIRTDSLQDIISCLENDFIDFLKVTKVSESDKFPFLQSDEFPTVNDNTDNTDIMVNKYGMKFYHDFKKDNIADVAEKYARRIEKFIRTICESKEIIFIRDELKMKSLSIPLIEKFISLIKSKYNSGIIIKFYVIYHNPKNKKIDVPENDNIIIINDVLPFVDWKRPNIDLSFLNCSIKK